MFVRIKVSLKGEPYGYQENASLSHITMYHFLLIPITDSKHRHGYADPADINAPDLFCLFIPLWH